MIICVDFDGTIVDHAFPEIGNPVPEAIKWLKYFQKNDVKLILWTMRSDGQQYGDVLTQAVNYLEGCGIKLFGVNENPQQKEWTDSPKAYGNIYIDDAAAGCPLIKLHNFHRACVDWDKVCTEIIRNNQNYFDAKENNRKLSAAMR